MSIHATAEMNAAIQKFTDTKFKISEKYKDRGGKIP